MKKNIVILFVFCLGLAFSFSQSRDVTTANSKISEVRLSGFEDASFWDVQMPIDQGVISKQSRHGVPYDVSSDSSFMARRDQANGIPSYSKQKVLGIRVEYIARGYNWFSIRPIKPIVIEGVCQQISCFVAGRNYKHWLKILILDFFGRERILTMDKLNHIGWKELVVSIPGNNVIAQSDYHYVDKRGIKFNGFVVECDPIETYGTYYLYFDELRAVTDLFNEKTRDLDDMRDDW